jgi:elongation factor Ts
MSISAKEVMDLRKQTGVSMMACKKALEEANGDAEAAIEILRKQGDAKAAKKSDRATSEGGVAIHGNAIVSVQCETDFVARNEDFIAFVEDLAAEASANGADAAKAKFEAEKVEKISQLGENLVFGEAYTIDADVVAGYVHSNRKVACLVGLTGGNADVAADVAMHATAMNPEVLSPEEVSDELVEKEKEIWKEQLLAEGKPEAILDKIMMGKEKKFREDSALIKQPFVKEQDKTVEEYAKENGAEVVKFVRVAV